MRRPGRLGNENGIATVMAMMVLVAMAALVAVYLAVSSYEPQISQNLAGATQARYAAEAGVEWAFDQLKATPNWSTLLTGSTGCGAPVTPAGWGNVWPAGMSGTVTIGFTVRLRNDCQADDNQITGVALDTGTAIATTDYNGILIATATGTYGSATGPSGIATKTIQVVMRKAPWGVLDPPGAINEPGVQSDTYIGCDGSKATDCATVNANGADHSCTGCTTDDAWYNDANWTEAVGNPAKFAIATQTGTQTNVGQTYESVVEDAVNDGNSGQQALKASRLKGKHQTTGVGAEGANTIAPSDALTPAKMADFLNTIASNSNTTILQSTQACPLRLQGGLPSDQTQATSTPILKGVCNNPDRTLNLGTPSDPKLVYFRGDPDPTSQFTGLQVDYKIKGAGVLIVEDGDLRLYQGGIEWVGLVIVTGQYVGAGFMQNTNSTITGAFISNETKSGESQTFYEILFENKDTSATFRYSKQALEVAQKALKPYGVDAAVYGWREL